MVNIVYSGIKDKYLQGIRKNLKQKDAVFTPLPDDYEPILKEKHKDALIIGEEINNPIRLAQEAYSLDNNLSILIISEPSHYKKLKQALLFTPFIGSSVNCVSDGDDIFLANTVEGLIKQTKQRRNFQTLKNIGIPVHSTPKIEQLKKEYINKFFEKAPVGAILLDHDSGILGLNHQAAIIMNTHETELLGNTLYSFFPDALKNEVKGFLDVEYKLQPKRIFLKSLTPEQFIEIAVTEVKTESNFIYKISIISDITEKVIKDRQIQDQVAELKKINTDLDNFIYTASHDLKSPISNIEGLVYTLKDIALNNGDPKEQEEILDLIEKSIVRFKGTIQDLSDIAKIQRNIEDDYDHVVIESTIQEVIHSLDKEIKDADAKIVFHTNQCPNIWISKASLKSILYNLVSNAIKYRSPERKIQVQITCSDMVDFTFIEIKDNGLGISKNNQGKMFSMFKRFHDHVDGTGIGLYIVKRIIENSGGKIEVESEVGIGTTFKVYIKKTPKNRI